MLKNILIPLTIIMLTTLVVVYYCYIQISMVMLVLISGLTFTGGGTHIFYYIFCKLFPDKRNLSNPPSIDLIKSPRTFNRERTKTKAFILTSTFSLILWGAGTFLWFVLSNKYTEYQLASYGKKTKGIITYVSTNSKRFGTYSEYEYCDETGKYYTNIIVSETLKIGDSISVYYSTKRPEINKVTY